MEQFVFDPTAFGPVFAPLLETDQLNALGPGSPVQALGAKLHALDLDQAFAPRQICDRSMARACLAGLWLLHDFLDESHNVSQELETTTGSYWHGLMHRREPDFGNAAYWFRRIGEHPIFDVLRQETAHLTVGASLETAAAFFATQKKWDPFAFIDLCEAVAAGKARCELLCRKVQQIEFQLLFDHSYQAAVGV
jgi:hypothetical protein